MQGVNQEEKALEEFNKVFPFLKDGNDLEHWANSSIYFGQLSAVNRKLIHRVIFAAYDAEGHMYRYTDTQKAQAKDAFTKKRKDIQKIKDLEKISYPTGIESQMQKKKAR